MAKSERDIVIGRRIAEIREDRRMSQAWTADQIGASKHVLAHWEHGQRISVGDLEKLASVFSCSIDDFRALPGASIPRMRKRRRPLLF